MLAATSRSIGSFMTSVPGVFACGDAARGPEPGRLGDRRWALVGSRR